MKIKYKLVGKIVDGNIVKADEKYRKWFEEYRLTKSVDIKTNIDIDEDKLRNYAIDNGIDCVVVDAGKDTIELDGKERSLTRFLTRNGFSEIDNDEYLFVVDNDFSVYENVEMSCITDGAVELFSLTRLSLAKLYLADTFVARAIVCESTNTIKSKIYSNHDAHTKMMRTMLTDNCYTFDDSPVCVEEEFLDNELKDFVDFEYKVCYEEDEEFYIPNYYD